MVQPGLASLMGGSVSSLSPLFADSFANFDVALANAASVVIVEFLMIAWVRHNSMNTPLLQATFLVVVDGLIVFATAVLIGRS